MREQLDSYGTNGYLVVPGALASAEASAANEAIDRDLVDNASLWRAGSPGRTQQVNILMAQPALDFTMRPPRLLPLMQAIMGPELCAEEHSAMIRAANPDGPLECQWHRDNVGDRTWPFRTGRLSVVYYLTDVDDSTHTFSVIPGSSQTQELPDLDTYDLDSAHHIEGAAGTAILFNAALYHAGNVRITRSERRTIHIYCGHTSDPALSNYTIFPRRLWQDEDEATQRYYSRLNPITKLVEDQF